MKRPDGVTIIALGDFLVGGMVLLGACAILMSMATIAFAPGEAGGRMVAIGFVGIGLLATLAAAAMSLAAGWGLWRLREWGRWVTIVLAILMLLGFPFGTVLGGLMIWYLLKPEVARAFGASGPVVPSTPAAWRPAMPGAPAGASASASVAAVFPPIPPAPDSSIPPAAGER
ncbi:MAG: hypothetical protein WCF84_21480 [Anaerolineae bacterium]